MHHAHETRKYGNGTVVCLQGQPADCLYVMRRGRVGVYINIDCDQPTAEQVLSDGVRVGTLEHEDHFIGEGGLFLSRRGASLIALTDGTTIEHVPLGGAGLRQVMLEQPPIGLKLCRSLAERLREVTERVREVCTVAESVTRRSDQLSVNLAELMQKVTSLSVTLPALAQIVMDFSESPLCVKGELLARQRNDTTIFFSQAARQQRSGVVRLKAGEVLCEEGRMGRALFLVRQGELRVTTGKVTVGYVGRNEIVGEIAVLLKELPKRSATVTAVENTVLNAIPALRFHSLAIERPAILVALAQTLAGRLDTTNRLVCQRSRSSGNVLEMLAGGCDSYESQFRQLARGLRNVAGAEELAGQAEDLAQKAVRVRSELEANYLRMMAAGQS